MFPYGSAGLQWRKSSYSTDTGTDCVEVALAPEWIVVRDSKDPDGPVLSFEPKVFAAFLARLGGGSRGVAETGVVQVDRALDALAGGVGDGARVEKPAEFAAFHG